MKSVPVVVTGPRKKRDAMDLEQTVGCSLGQLVIDETMHFTVTRIRLEKGRLFLVAHFNNPDAREVTITAGSHQFVLYAPDGTSVMEGRSNFPHGTAKNGEHLWIEQPIGVTMDSF